MRSSIRPLTELREVLVTEYLTGQGLTPELVRWKYFDPALETGGRERGFAWLRDERIAGFIGLIPTRLGRGDESFDMSWTCDWSLSKRVASPGVGVLLLKQAIESTHQLMYVGTGSAHTASIAPRIADHVIEDAGLVALLPLRLGYWAERLSRALPFVRAERWPWLPQLPARRLPRSSARVRVADGISSAIGPLLEEPRGPGWYPRYSHGYVDWVVGRCPELSSGTAWAPSDAAPRACAVFWRSRASERFWRMALWAQPGADDLLADVIRCAARRIYESGGWLVSTLVSRRDELLRSSLQRCGALIGRSTKPLYVLATKGPRVDELSNLSFVDADLAYEP